MVTRSSYNERLNIAFLQGEAPDLFAVYQQAAFDSLYDSGYLRLFQRAFRNCLSVADHIIFLPPPVDTADPVHHILSASSLIQDHISLLQRPCYSAEHDLVPSVNEKRRHAVSGNCDRNVFSFLNHFLYRIQEDLCIHSFNRYIIQFHQNASLLIFKQPSMADYRHWEIKSMLIFQDSCHFSNILQQFSHLFKTRLRVLARDSGQL